MVWKYRHNKAFGSTWRKCECSKKNGFTPLHEAAHRNEIEVVRFLIKKGADVNAFSAEGETPLHCAVCLPVITRMLLEKVARVNVLNKARKTPLALTKAIGDHVGPELPEFGDDCRECIALLRKYGAKK